MFREPKREYCVTREQRALRSHRGLQGYEAPQRGVWDVFHAQAQEALKNKVNRFFRKHWPVEGPAARRPRVLRRGLILTQRRTGDCLLEAVKSFTLFYMCCFHASVGERRKNGGRPCLLSHPGVEIIRNG